jgi:hypothetical protein
MNQQNCITTHETYLLLLSVAVVCPPDGITETPEWEGDQENRETIEGI